MSAIELTDVTVVLGGRPVVDRVDLTFDEGEWIALIGPNGAGKTTLFNCVSGFFPPTSGSIRFAGQEIAGWAPERVLRAGLARTFQVVRTFPEMTVLDNVMIGAFARTNRAGEARARAAELLAFTGLAGRAHARGADLTIADKKRLELTRALATQPRLLMLDEVMAGLNPAERAQAVTLIRAIRDRGTTVLLVEHVMEVIMPISDRVVVLNYGKKLVEDIPERVARNEEVIKAYLGDRFRAAG